MHPDSISQLPARSVSNITQTIDRKPGYCMKAILSDEELSRNAVKALFNELGFSVD